MLEGQLGPTHTSINVGMCAAGLSLPEERQSQPHGPLRFVSSSRTSIDTDRLRGSSTVSDSGCDAERPDLAQREFSASNHPWAKGSANNASTWSSWRGVKADTVRWVELRALEGFDGSSRYSRRTCAISTTICETLAWPSAPKLCCGDAGGDLVLGFQFSASCPRHQPPSHESLGWGWSACSHPPTDRKGASSGWPPEPALRSV
mmetsp:Transcript_42230/g.106538  ORF Transcript_42230/g.106538 Transcript_42230/m.106538 type:complete len:204 (-) Transcript_42230:1106-1717(-)